MIKIAICDDENVIVSQIETILLNACQNIIPIDIDVFYSGQSLEKEVIQGTKYDLIYLDIQMENGDGITTARNIRKMDDSALLIYVSSHDKYMMEVFRFDVLAFIKKPIEENSFIKIFREANDKICSNNFFYVYRYKNDEQKVLCKDVLYFESRGRQIRIHNKNGKIEVFNGKLNEVQEKVLVGKIVFLRIHQSYLVNYYLIKSRSKKEVTLVDGTILPISEDRQKEFSKEYGKLLGGEICV
ncbi:MAG TPA: LytTR family DNA-binding domain-containing protein [Lachnospiraceae bacterium]|nr:LytTR family DNA-binding domain-containing protein [Lachnospiraceae bacterium]